MNASCMPSATSAAVWTVRADLVTERQDRRLVELLERAAAPPVGRGATADDHQRVSR